MLAMTSGVARRWRSGGKGRAGGLATDDADGALELDAVRVDVCLGGSLADQGAEGEMREQVAVDFLPSHVRGLRAQLPAGPAQVRLQLPVPALVLPSLVVGLRQ